MEERKTRVLLLRLHEEGRSIQILKKQLIVIGLECVGLQRRQWTQLQFIAQAILLRKSIVWISVLRRMAFG